MVTEKSPEYNIVSFFCVILPPQKKKKNVDNMGLIPDELTCFTSTLTL